MFGVNMRAMILECITNLGQNRSPLKMTDVLPPPMKPDELLVRISVCGVCHTELDEIEGRIHIEHLPLILGHQVVGVVEQKGADVSNIELGARVGIAWIFHACGYCFYCRSGNENLCPEFKATGRDAPGGYAEYMSVPAQFVYPIPDVFTDSQAAPLLCAGAIGFRSLALTQIGNDQILGLTGFGASGHLVLKMARFKYPDSKIFVFARSRAEQEFALELGADWSGDTMAIPPEQIDAIIDTTPVWKPVVSALQVLRPGGRLVVNAIRKEDSDKDYLRKIDYPQHLWMEKEIKSVANVTRSDVSGFLQLAAKIPLKPEFDEFDLIDANHALMELKESKIRGAKVLRIR